MLSRSRPCRWLNGPQEVGRLPLGIVVTFGTQRAAWHYAAADKEQVALEASLTRHLSIR